MPKSTGSRYTEEFKAEAVQLIRAYLEKCSIDKSAVSTDHCVCLAGAAYERKRAFEMIEYPLLQANYS